MADKYYIKDAITKPAVHHQSFKALWETKWQKPCEMGVYPFMFGSIKDFEPVAQELIEKDLKEPYDWDEYAETFFPKAEELATTAAEAEEAGEKDKAAEYYLRSSAVYRISRFPTPRSEKQFYAWKTGKEMFYKGQSLMENPIVEIKMPHTYAASGDGDTIYTNWLCPPTASAYNPVPCILIVTGLDGYRTELAVWQRGFLEKGVATVICEIPGTGDSPAKRDDPTSPDRQFSTILDWITAREEIDREKIIAWGFSTGGYYALRMAHTHKNQLMASISFGGGAHHMFDPEWLGHVNQLEYAFDLAGSLTYKFGYGNDLEKFKREAHKFSLVEDGTLDKPCTKVLLVNGSHDEIFPIDDMFVALEHGGPKEARIVHGKKHMGEPDSFFIILKWIYRQLGLEGESAHLMRTIPSRPKY